MIDYMDGSFVWVNHHGAHTIDIDEAMTGLVFIFHCQCFLIDVNLNDLTEHARLMYEILK